MIKYFAAVLLLASLAFGQGYVVLVNEMISSSPVGFPVGCIELFGSSQFILYNDSKVEIFSSCTEQNEETLVESMPCEAPSCEFVTELPKGLLKYSVGNSCESLANTMFLLFEDGKCVAMGESLSFLFELSSDEKNVTALAYENLACTGESFDSLEFEMGKCLTMEEGDGLEPTYAKIDHSTGIQTIVSMALLITMFIALI